MRTPFSAGVFVTLTLMPIAIFLWGETPPSCPYIFNVLVNYAGRAVDHPASVAFATHIIPAAIVNTVASFVAVAK